MKEELSGIFAFFGCQETLKLWSDQLKEGIEAQKACVLAWAVRRNFVAECQSEDKEEAPLGEH